MDKLSSDTFAERFAWRVQAHPDVPAFLQKRHGVWRAWTWAEVERQVQAVAAGLAGAGLAPGQAVGIASGARIEAVLAVLACQRAGLVPVLLNPNLAPGGLASFAQLAGIAALIAEDQEQVDKFADVQSRLPDLRTCWVIDPKGTRTYTHVRLQAFDQMQGEALSAPSGEMAAPAIGLFSAGVHREPRFVTVKNSDLMRLQAAGNPLGLLASGGAAGSRCASLFGFSDPIGFFASVVAPVLFGVVPCFGESRVPTVAELRQCAPEIVALPARLLDRLRRETSARAARTRGLQHQLIRQWIGGTQPRFPFHGLIGRPIAAALGLANVHTVFTGYERMSPVSARFLTRLGIATLGLYGLVEAGGPIGAFAQAEAPALKLFEGYDAELDSEGGMRIRFGGQTIDTGDLVSLSGGELHLRGRAADMLTLNDGKRVSPAEIESELLASPYVSQAIAVGGPAGGIGVLVELDEVTLRDWARAHGLAFTTLRSYAESTEVRRLIDQAVAEANQRLPPGMRVERALLLPRLLDPGNGELTPALALRRANIRNRYAHRLVQGVSS